MPTLTVYVPARASSERLKDKAILDFNGRPLITVIIDTLQKCDFINDLYINTESDSIAELCQKFGVKIYKRNISLASNDTTTEEILADFSKIVSNDFIAVINPTNPLLKEATIKSFFEEVFKESYDTAFSVTRLKKHAIIDRIPINYSIFGPHPRTQDVKTIEYLNWAIVSWKTSLVKERILKRGDSIYLGKIGFISIPELEAIDIDTLSDFDLARKLELIQNQFI